MQRLLQILEDGVDSFVAGVLGKVGQRDDASPPSECPFVGIAQAQPCPAVNHPLDLALQRPRVATKLQPVRRCEVVGLRIVEVLVLGACTRGSRCNVQLRIDSFLDGCLPRFVV